MKCLTALAVLTGVVLGGAIVFTNPQLPGQTITVVQRAADWVGSEVHQLTASHPTQAPTPSSAPGSPSYAPAPEILHPQTDAPEPENTPLFSAPAGPTVVPAPTSTATMVINGMPWSAEELNWAEVTLETDASLDQHAETDYPNLASYYATWSQRWATTYRDILALASGSGLTRAVAAQPPQWFALAIAVHQSDTLQNPQNAWWNNEWIANYQRLARDWAQLTSA